MIYIYDDSFDGFLTVIFDIYDLKIQPADICRERNHQPSLFAEKRTIITDGHKAGRVLSGIKKKLSLHGVHGIYKCWLSEQVGIEMMLFRYISYAIKSKRNIENDFSDSDVLEVSQVVKKINREIHRMHAFVRFQKTRDGVYAATIAPDFDVVTLLAPHFKERYKSQQWFIYDTKRQYGIYYDLSEVVEVKLENAQWQGRNKVSRLVLAEEEKEFELWWKSYFKATSIEERANIKLHLKHVPRRYWRYLPEKV
ncbi:TIGR03915 family putative DNA repair protein [Fulvivirga sediminis]|uniref:TIGR03915 family putative DNA repair protein n=1 Tax=Fulvivirga sediminis TaxID=2803949 RepID=A0A937JZH6_9BACT|nr:TIGR03915 family putative DNA repair protein [Fulvivirga sediminis]MBL3655211.1 TIGR03915 family putative DNA repair protein [Fulvivirga sediminis]